MATPPPSDPGTRSFSAGSTAPSPIKRLASRLPHAKRRRSTARRVVIAVLAGLATLAILLGIDAFWSGRTMFRGVATARGALTEGTVAVVTGDPEAAVPHFEHAAEAADAALAAAHHPSIALARRLPWIGDNLRAVDAVAEASRASAEAGLTMVEAARILDWQDLRIPAAEAIGDVDLEALGRAAPLLDEVATQLGVAAARLETADTGRLVGPVAAGFEDAVETIDRRATIALDTRDLVELLPRLLGVGRQRRYLLAVQTLGRPQGIGGEVDLIGVVTADDGAMALTTELTPAGEEFAGATATSDGRSAGENLLAAARSSGLGELDGVLLTDSLWLADAVWTTGSVDVPDRKLPVNSDEAARVLEREVFKKRDAQAAATRRAEVATAVVESYLARRPATEAFAVALARDVAERHLIVVAAKPRERRVIERLGAGGLPEPPARHVLGVSWDTVVDNHAAVFAHRDVTHRVLLTPEGVAKTRTVVTLVNEAPSDPPSALLGFPLPATVPEPGEVNPVGGWAADVAVLLPPKAENVSAETSIPSETEIVKVEGVSSAVGRLATDPGDTMSLLVGYRVPDDRIAEGTYRMAVSPQPSWPAGLVRIRIDAPPGTTIVEGSEELEIGGTVAEFAGRPTRPFGLWIRFE
jgi:hypothetical protein